MTGLFSKQAAVYAATRPTYPKDLFAKLATLTAHHRLPWDVGTGSGQAAISVAGHYDSVVATDMSAEQLRHAAPHPKVRYLHTPDATQPRGGARRRGQRGPHHCSRGCALVDLQAFFGVARRVLRRPGGVIVVWGYNYRVSPMEDMMVRFYHTTVPYWDPRARHAMDGYVDLPFPFDDIGLGREGKPVSLDMEQEMSFEGLVGMLRSWSAVTTAKLQCVDLLSEPVVKEMEEEWGGPSLIRKVTFKTFLLAARPGLMNEQNTRQQSSTCLINKLSSGIILLNKHVDVEYTSLIKTPVCRDEVVNANCDLGAMAHESI